MQLDGVRGEVADEDGEELVEHVLVETGQRGLLQDQLAVHDQREELADGEQEVEVAALLLVGRDGGDELAEGVGLFAEAGDVRARRRTRRRRRASRGSGRSRGRGPVPGRKRNASSAASRRVGTGSYRPGRAGGCA